MGKGTFRGCVFFHIERSRISSRRVLPCKFWKKRFSYSYTPTKIQVCSHTSCSPSLWFPGWLGMFWLWLSVLGWPKSTGTLPKHWALPFSEHYHVHHSRELTWEKMYPTSERNNEPSKFMWWSPQIYREGFAVWTLFGCTKSKFLYMY